MKNLKLILLLCLVFVLAITAVACGSEPVGTETAPQTSVTTAPTTTLAETSAVTTTVIVTEATTAAVTTEAPKQFASLKIGDTPISEYTIVYARSEYAPYLKMPTMKKYFPVYDFDRESATRLSDMIYHLSGVRLKIVEDVGHAEEANEILIGDTNRDFPTNAVVNNLKDDDYIIDVLDTKLAICGGVCGTTWHALDYLEDYLAKMLDEGATEYSFDADYKYQGSHHMIRIACIGDSITQGSNASATMLTYPAQLSRILWKDAIVTNLGSSGSTMRNDLAAYTQRDVYKTALNIAAETDLFTVMLGTNDSYYDTNWTSADSQKFNEDCLAIFKSLWDKNQSLRFVLANCPRYFGGGGWASVTVRGLQRNLVPTLNDAGYPTTYFDMFTATANMSAYFPDQLHPNDEGYMIMAQKFAEGLQPIIDAMQK